MIKKIRNRFMNLFLPFYFKLRPIKKGLNLDQNRKRRIVVSLTSIPSRFDTLHLSLESILRQTYKPDKIILYLGKEYKYEDIPKSIVDMVDKGLEIRFREDLKPHTKYFYAFCEFSNDIVITVDDDIFYRKTLIEELYHSYLKYPKAVSCMRAHEIMFDNSRNIKKYNEWNSECKDIINPSHKLCATGVGGVLYPPNCMGDEVLNLENIKKLSFKADDIWLKFMQLKENTKVVIANPKKTDITVINKSQVITLHSENVGCERNDMYIKNLMDKYNINLYNKCADVDM